MEYCIVFHVRHPQSWMRTEQKQGTDCGLWRRSMSARRWLWWSRRLGWLRWCISVVRGFRQGFAPRRPWRRCLGINWNVKYLLTDKGSLSTLPLSFPSPSCMIHTYKHTIFLPYICLPAFFFFCVPSYISGVHHFWWDFCICDRFLI